MPHLVIEHSRPLECDGDALCAALFDRLAVHPNVPQPSSLKIRTVPATHWRIGTEPQSFAHATVWLLPGRDAAARASLAQAILDTMASLMPATGSLSVDVQDLDPSYAKRVL
jgi:5-carboxymethyl-2-hydroxymuconate isomerase